ncbi:hypothetical protein [Oharaeibacter diazotrophicus]|uniref:4-amino-4-deoxy-L-arabinose transferase-like glycosyltransferase n=2 Tax=Oharaeibacter diazotrophicus TaxID=1920512 RepID=A0A4R6RFD9_9HYPH|nr:hypothetical protein [Oharaeibacter diazotrophicus]TDP85013.1 hypothetical protein EDD54_1858 [Oharaeibacter diazotrophicus]BBE73983.1 hypothetical protein OHA_1_03609 [Pleomorphomonas sp. SM30]
MPPERSAVTLAAPSARALPGDVPLPAVVLFLLAVFVAAGGWLPALAALGDPESAMRLVAVREFLGGRGWYDLLEPRLGLSPGVMLPWSRLADLPLATLILALDPAAGRPAAELLAVNLWPPIAFVLFGWGVVATVLRFADGVAAAAALVLVVLSPPALALFAPGHLGVDTLHAVLFAWTLAALVRADGSARAAAAAGVLVAASIAIGPGTPVPMLLAGAVPALAWIRDGDRWRRGFAAYGIAFAAAVAVFFLLCVPPARWSVPATDRLSAVHLVAAAVGGLGAAAIARVLRGGPADGATGYLLRGAGVAGVVSVLVAVVAAAFPGWLDAIGADPRPGALSVETATAARSVLDVARLTPWQLPGHFAGPAVALVLATVAAAVSRRGRSYGPVLLAASLAASLVMALWRQGDLAIAQIAAAVAITVAGTVIARNGLGPRHPAAPLLHNAWVLAAPLLWALTGDLALDGTQRRLQRVAAVATAECLAALGETLAALPPGLVVAPPAYGPHLLLRTASPVLAAPFPTAVEGVLAADAILFADDGRRPFDAAGARTLALCPHDADTRALAGRAPQGLASRLVAGERPAWLEVVADGPAALVLRRRTEPTDVTGSLPPPVLRPALD